MKRKNIKYKNVLKTAHIFQKDTIFEYVSSILVKTHDFLWICTAETTFRNSKYKVAMSLHNVQKMVKLSTNLQFLGLFWTRSEPIHVPKDAFPPQAPNALPTRLYIYLYMLIEFRKFSKSPKIPVKTTFF